MEPINVHDYERLVAGSPNLGSVGAGLLWKQ